MRIPLLTLPLLLLLTACTTARTGGIPPAADQDPGPAGATPARMLLREAFLDLRTPEPDSALAYLSALATRLGGYPAEITGYSATLRIPNARLEEALAAGEGLGRVVERSISSTDVTDQYRDLGIRLDNARRARERYLELLARVTSVADGIAVERELERLAETIDLLEGRRAGLEQREALAVLRVRVGERTKPGPLGYVLLGLWKGVSWLFVR